MALSCNKNISGLLRGITSNHNGDFYCLNCFHSYTSKRKLKKHERICKDHDFCDMKMPDKYSKILKYNPGEQSLKIPFIIYADLECLIKKINTCKNNPNKSYTEKKQSTYHQVIQYLSVFYLINLKMNENILEEMTV